MRNKPFYLWNKPFYLWGAWLNLALNIIWLVTFLLMQISSWLFVPQLAISILILLFAGWVHNRENNVLPK